MDVQALRKQLVLSLKALHEACPGDYYTDLYQHELDAYNACYDEQLPE